MPSYQGVNRLAVDVSAGANIIPSGGILIISVVKLSKNR
uniref:Uncharacterized protein n=1 Tax=Arundo donax TaxID=35708 RepID=A0A0A9CVX2_ARUDO